MKKLIIVESPSKANTIQKYLKDQGFKVIASKGHIRDLPTKELGVDINNSFKISEVTINGKESTVKEIKELAKEADEIYLASDPDREGEKISQSIYDILPDKKNKKIKRVKFNSVTKDAIEKAIKNAGDIDDKRCDAQKVRRILDRLVGYKISPILWNKIKSGLSAGRVQSVALRVIQEREDEITNFIPEHWFSIIAKFKKEELSFASEYYGKSSNKKSELQTRQEAEEILSRIKEKDFSVHSIEVKEREQKPTPPFTTSKLQQEASVKLKFDTKLTMQIAQKLYEGVFIKDKGTHGLITYMRTDSVRVEPEAIQEVRKMIETEYGTNYLPQDPIEHKDKKQQNVQDAHEAIRPTKIELKPDDIKSDLTDDEYKLYSLIYAKFVSSQMKSAIIEQKIVFLECDKEFFRTTGSTVKFDGFRKVFDDLKEEKRVKKGDSDESEAVLPELKEKELLSPIEIPKIYEKKTTPPARFNEATLVKELEDKGVGRPSTYAAIIGNITGKMYVEKEKTRFKPTDLGTQVIRALVEYFPKEMDVKFTAKVEDSLDDIESGSLKWLDFMNEFWESFEKSLSEANSKMIKTRVDSATKSGIKCDTCSDGEYIVKSGKNGEFLACSNYPSCKSTKNFEKEGDKYKIVQKSIPQKLTKKECPLCASKMVLISLKNGNKFYSCSKYPECRGALPKNSTGVKCVTCNQGEIVPKISKNKNKFFGCSNYPKCKQVYWNEEDLVKLDPKYKIKEKTNLNKNKEKK